MGHLRRFRLKAVVANRIWDVGYSSSADLFLSLGPCLIFERDGVSICERAGLCAEQGLRQRRMDGLAFRLASSVFQLALC